MNVAIVCQHTLSYGGQACSRIIVAVGDGFIAQIATGHHQDSWAAWFDDLTISHAPDGATTLEGSIRDQSALYGLIDKARDLGLTLVAVGRSAPPDRADELHV